MLFYAIARVSCLAASFHYWLRFLFVGRASRSVDNGAVHFIAIICCAKIVLSSFRSLPLPPLFILVAVVFSLSLGVIKIKSCTKRQTQVSIFPSLRSRRQNYHSARFAAKAKQPNYNFTHFFSPYCCSTCVHRLMCCAVIILTCWLLLISIPFCFYIRLDAGASLSFLSVLNAVFAVYLMKNL